MNYWPYTIGSFFIGFFLVMISVAFITDNKFNNSPLLKSDRWSDFSKFKARDKAAFVLFWIGIAFFAIAAIVGISGEVISNVRNE